MTEEVLSDIYDILLIIILCWGFADIDENIKEKITNNLMKSMHSYSNAFNSIKFVDGSPFGIKE